MKEGVFFTKKGAKIISSEARSLLREELKNRAEGGEGSRKQIGPLARERKAFQREKC